jgi:hypothetical protein
MQHFAVIAGSFALKSLHAFPRVLINGLHVRSGKA